MVACGSPQACEGDARNLAFGHDFEPCGFFAQHTRGQQHAGKLCQQLLDEIVLLSEDEIADGIRHAAREEGLIVEGAGAVGFAAILSGKVKISGPTAIIVSGGNIDPTVHKSIVDGGVA